MSRDEFCCSFKISDDSVYDILEEINKAGKQGTYINSLSDKLGKPDAEINFYIIEMARNKLIRDIGLKRVPCEAANEIMLYRHFKLTKKGGEILQNRLT